MADEARAVIFGRDAVTYDDARPGYPSAAVDHVMGLVDATVAVEVGAGTGKATESVAREDLRLTCLEPSPQMATLLETKHLPGVKVVVSTFEDWDGEPGSIDLIFAAQAWHWLDRERSFDKALAFLRPGGVLALLWNIPVDRYGRHRELYSEHAPHLLADQDERIKRRDDHQWADDMARQGFEDTERFTHRWSEELTSGQYRDLYSTYSDHMMLEEPARTRLLDGLKNAVDGWGGTVKLQYRTEVFSGRKPIPDRQ